VHSILHGKVASKYSGKDIDAMKAVALAHKHRSLKEFEDALKAYDKELNQDPIIKSHLAALYDNLLEQNLVRIIEPYSRVDIAHVASLVNLSVQQVEQKVRRLSFNNQVVSNDFGQGLFWHFGSRFWMLGSV
jgi:26S proteasome regulatory subunit N6